MKSVVWVLLTVLFWTSSEVEGLGVNWGTMASHKMDPKTVVQMMKDNGINKVKLFDADQSTMGALAGTGIEVMIAIPNDQLADMNDYGRAKKFVQRNITRYNFNGGVNIKKLGIFKVQRVLSQTLHKADVQEIFSKGETLRIKNSESPGTKYIFMEKNEAGAVSPGDYT